MTLLALLLTATTFAAKPTPPEHAALVHLTYQGLSSFYTVSPEAPIDDVWHDLGGTYAPPWSPQPVRDLQIHIASSLSKDGETVDMVVALTRLIPERAPEVLPTRPSRCPSEVSKRSSPLAASSPASCPRTPPSAACPGSAPRAARA